MTALTREYKVRQEMDDRIIPLVNALNSLPGIETFTSCGGHEEKTDFSQCEIDEFSVGFGIDPEEHGLISLGVITGAANQIKPGFVMVRTALKTRIPDGFNPIYDVGFLVIGVNGADPNKLADELEKYRTDIFNR